MSEQGWDDRGEGEANVPLRPIGVGLHGIVLRLDAQLDRHLSKEDLRLVDAEADGHGPTIVAIRFPVGGDDRRTADLPATLKVQEVEEIEPRIAYVFPVTVRTCE